MIQPVATPSHPEYTVPLNGHIGDLQFKYFAAHTPLELLCFGASGVTGDSVSQPVRVAGRNTIVMQVVAGSGTFTVQGSLDGVTWVTVGTLGANNAVTTITQPVAYLRVNAATTTGTYNVALAAW